MQSKTIKPLLAFSLFFTALWFFGNLYEEVIIAPNQLINAYEKLKHWQLFFAESNPMYFYVPFTQLSTLIICVLYFKVSNAQQKSNLKKAAIYCISAIALTVIIVTQINLKIFYGDLDKYKDQLFTLSVIWLIGNAIRLCLVGSSMHYIFKAYVLQQMLEKE